MKQTNAPELLVDDILQEINVELNKRKKLISSASPVSQAVSKESTCNQFVNTQRTEVSGLFKLAKQIAKLLQRYGFYSLVAFVRQHIHLHKYHRVYNKEDFTQFFGAQFIENAFELILQRKPDHQGMLNYLSLLSSGESSKIQILISLLLSKEGRKQNIIIKGIKKRHYIVVLYQIPLIGYLIKLMVTIASLPGLLKRINQNENYMMVELSNTRQELYALIEKNSAESEREHKQYLGAVMDAKTQLKISQKSMQTLIDEAKSRLPINKKHDLTQAQLEAIIDEEKYQLDSFYIEFEAKYRGSKDDIKQRVSVYIDYLENLTISKEKIKILDIGCGRGEWLELLKENAYQAKGIDLNRVMAENLKQQGLNVSQGDAIKYLETLSDNSLSVITGFHIIEHLPFTTLVNLFEQSLRVIEPGGMVIFETPNPENILVAAHFFYLDPTHIAPLVPATTNFLLENTGFIRVQIKRLHKYSDYHHIENDNRFIQDNFANEMDYAVIGYKAGGNNT